MRHAKPGFSLMELLIAVVIMGILAAISIPLYQGRVEATKKKTASQQIKLLRTSIEFFELDLGKIPEKLQDLVRRPAPSDYYDQESLAEWADGGYIKGGKVPKDPWKKKFVYKLTPGGTKTYELYSYGPKGKGAPKSEWIK